MKIKPCIMRGNIPYCLLLSGLLVSCLVDTHFVQGETDDLGGTFTHPGGKGRSGQP